MKKAQKLGDGFFRRAVNAVGRGILGIVLLIVLLIRSVFRALLPPTKQKARHTWQVQERRRIRSQSPPDPVSGLLLTIPGHRVAADRKRREASRTSREEAGTGEGTGTVSPLRDGRGRAFAGFRSELIPSEERLLRHLRKCWLRRTMIFCAIGAGVCMLAIPILSSFSVRSIVVSGNSYYGADALTEMAALHTGDALLAVEKTAVEERLRKECAYLSDVVVTRHWNGTVEIAVCERTPMWALALPEGGYAILDSSLTVLEVTEQTSGFSSVILLCVLGQGETDEALSAGSVLPGAAEFLPIVKEAEAALQGSASELPSAPAVLHMEDRSRVSLLLADGTRILMGSSSDMEGKLRTAGRAIARYRSTNPTEEGDALTVDAREVGKISIRVSEKAES